MQTEATRRDEIARFWEYQINDGATGLALSIDALEVEGEVVIETGRYAGDPATVAAIRTAIEAAGVQFIPENGGGAGVRMKKGI